MGLFQEVTGEVAIIVKNGVYRQVPVYMRNGYYYAKFGAGFIRLNADGSTTEATARLETLTADGIQSLAADTLGRLCDPAAVPGAKPLPQSLTQKLLGIESK
jgi:hypothetical protein